MSAPERAATDGTERPARQDTERVAPAGPNAASATRRVLAQAAFEARAVLRNGEQLLLILILPVLLLVGLSRSELVALETGGLARVDVAAPGILALAVMSTAFTSQAIATAFDRRAGVLRLLATTPLGRGGLLAGKSLAVLAVLTGQVVLLGCVALLLGWAPAWSGLGVALLGLGLGTAAFTAFALLLAGTMRPEAVLAAANLTWILLLAGGGVLVPAAQLPQPWGTLAAFLPSGALADVLRVALGAPLGGAGGGLGGAAGPLLVLGGWTVALAVAARRLFRWS